ncbi:hypothetical protein JAAARDRAFT_46404 [Jaapia argillacea MUCL 33604]|uniref:Fungal-type protein kinase domain-containing protein n=1 Tax=Jaapia argillacea MUCL 33604 TaxID=933084 RepID=A0A067PY73_9AGAM|nr:hypothetical protein JAAARDRAFT_46404 [Jaapia argillacea MUCL 33604]
MCPEFLRFTPDEFLREFVPLPTDSEGNTISPPTFDGAFDKMDTDRDKNLVYSSFAACLDARNICPGYSIAAAESDYALDDDGRKKVATCLFNTADAANMAGNKPLWSNQAMHIESSTSRHAPIEDPFYEDEDATLYYASDVESRRNTLRHIISYAAALTNRQHRTFFFTLLVLGTDARIIRWGRAGAAVTEPFNYREDSSLAVFLWRFSRLSMEQQGYDPTATRFDAEDPLIQRALAVVLPEHHLYIRNSFREAVSSQWPVYKLVVEHELPPGHEAYLEETSEGELITGGDSPRKELKGYISGKVEHREYIVGKPKFKTNGVTGRGTRGYVALDVKTEKFVWLKDVWRLDSLHREGDMVQELNDVKVRFGPPPPEDSNPMKEYIHYRLVVAEVGLDLSEFSNGRELVRVIRDCLIAHRDAYEQLSVLHRDVSAGNILIVPGPGHLPGSPAIRRGMLNDWELCKKLNQSSNSTDEDAELGQDNRVGTWAFMSGLLVLDVSRRQDLQDDLESFFHVLLHHAVVYLDNNCRDVPAFVANFFDSCIITSKGQRGGQSKHYAIRIEGRIVDYCLRPILFLNRSPMNALIERLMRPFHHYYLAEEARIRATYASLPRRNDSNPVEWLQHDDDWESDNEEDSSDDDDSDSDTHEYVNMAQDLSVSEKKAKALSSHQYMIRVFRKFLNVQWYEDKVSHNPIKATLTPATSNAVKRKRELEEAELEDEEIRPKRLKPATKDDQPKSSNQHNMSQTKSDRH